MEAIVPSIEDIVIPDNKYKAVLILQQINTELFKLQEQVTNEITKRLDELAKEKPDDVQYTIEPVFSNRKSSTLDVEKFKEEMPDAYKNSLTIKASDAEKLLGKQAIKDLIIAQFGWEIFEDNANCTLGEAKNNIPKAMLGKYITEGYQQTGYKIVEKYND